MAPLFYASTIQALAPLFTTRIDWRILVSRPYLKAKYFTTQTSCRGSRVSIADTLPNPEAYASAFRWLLKFFWKDIIMLLRLMSPLYTFTRRQKLIAFPDNTAYRKMEIDELVTKFERKQRHFRFFQRRFFLVMLLRKRVNAVPQDLFVLFHRRQPNCLNSLHRWPGCSTSNGKIWCGSSYSNKRRCVCCSPTWSSFCHASGLIQANTPGRRNCLKGASSGWIDLLSKLPFLLLYVICRLPPCPYQVPAMWGNLLITMNISLKAETYTLSSVALSHFSSIRRH